MTHQTIPDTHDDVLQHIPDQQLMSLICSTSPPKKNNHIDNFKSHKQIYMNIYLLMTQSDWKSSHERREIYISYS